MLSLGKEELDQYRPNLAEYQKAVLDNLTEEEIKSDKNWLIQQLKCRCNEELGVDLPEVIEIGYCEQFVHDIDNLELDLLRYYLHSKDGRNIPSDLGLDNLRCKQFVEGLSKILEDADSDPGRGPMGLNKACGKIDIDNQKPVKKFCIAIVVFIDGDELQEGKWKENWEIQELYS